jgi:hypothetical protein
MSEYYNNYEEDDTSSINTEEEKEDTLVDCYILQDKIRDDMMDIWYEVISKFTNNQYVGNSLEKMDSFSKFYKFIIKNSPEMIELNKYINRLEKMVEINRNKN